MLIRETGLPLCWDNSLGVSGNFQERLYKHQHAKQNLVKNVSFIGVVSQIT